MEAKLTQQIAGVSDRVRNGAIGGLLIMAGFGAWLLNQSSSTAKTEAKLTTIEVVTPILVEQTQTRMEVGAVKAQVLAVQRDLRAAVNQAKPGSSRRLAQEPVPVRATPAALKAAGVEVPETAIRDGGS